MKRFFLAMILAVTFSSTTFGYTDFRGKGVPPNGDYPVGPHLKLTPGKLCDTPSEHRYPERIAYCERKVSTKLKKEIIAEYDAKLGFHVQEMPRRDFKIDHFYPLCAGGSNDRENLWPQHKSVYEITDPLEPEVCNRMAEGKLTQQEALELIRRAKLNLHEADEIFEHLMSL